MLDYTTVIGRYAPSPTGELHLGNLRTAILAWLHARLQGGKFLLRMDDLDQPRVVKGSAEQILRDLEWLGLNWDGEVVFQSQRTELYQDALSALTKNELTYECFCSRKDIQQAASAPHVSLGVYPGTCRDLDPLTADQKRANKTPAIRACVDDTKLQFNDGCLGEFSVNLNTACGDFVVKRADGLFAYQLATAVDDLEQGITDVVRGADLSDSTARQLYLMQRLQPGFSMPQYWHVPLMLDEKGDRMAKRDGSSSIAEWRTSGRDALELIGMLAASVDLIKQPLAISLEELLTEITFDNWLAQIRSCDH